MPEPGRSGPLVGHDDIYAAVGRFICLWSEVERELRKAIQELEPGAEAPKMIGPSLGKWRELHDALPGHDPVHGNLVADLHRLLKCDLDLRNAICHRRFGWRAKTHPDAEDASLTVDLATEEVRLPLAELARRTERVGNSVTQIWRLTLVAQHPTGPNVAGVRKEIREFLNAYGDPSWPEPTCERCARPTGQSVDVLNKVVTLGEPGAAGED